MRVNLGLVLCFTVFAAAPACTSSEMDDVADGDVGDPTELVPADDTDDGKADSIQVGDFDPGDLVRVCRANALNQRSGPGTSYGVVATLPKGSTTKIIERDGNWYHHDWAGKKGWSSGKYLCAVEAGTEPPAGDGFDSTTVSRSSFMSIAEAAVGYSYYWGGGKFASGASRGACYGNCPNCTHSGSYGADCSGFIGKVWLLPASLPMSSNKHPYSTYHFYNNKTVWGSVSRSNLEQGDALVHRSGGGGHIVLYDKDDPWGSFWTYEARGCSYGIVHNIRTVSSSYKGIRRDGV